jgi:BirA family biotin operon repressor/biotin-[acetyl-CoA-carboxylase] ligase
MTMLASESIRKLLTTKTLGKITYFFEEIGSTNEVAFELARNGATEGTVIVADSQTKGKGRLQRKWISPPGVNLYMSVVVRPPIAAQDAPFLTLIASVALAKTIKDTGIDTLVKWPNDVLINGKKVAGTLTVMQPRGGEVDFVIVGIGANLNMTREMMDKEMGEVAEMATSLREALGREIERAKFAADLINQLEIWYQKFLKDGKAPIIKEWIKRWGWINRRVRVKFNEVVVEGIASGIDENGYLLVKKNDGTTERIISGDVILF